MQPIRTDKFHLVAVYRKSILRSSESKPSRMVGAKMTDQQAQNKISADHQHYKWSRKRDPNCHYGARFDEWRFCPCIRWIGMQNIRIGPYCLCLNPTGSNWVLKNCVFFLLLCVTLCCFTLGVWRRCVRFSAECRGHGQTSGHNVLPGFRRHLRPGADL